LYREVQIELHKRLIELSTAAHDRQNGAFERALASCEAQRQLCLQIGEEINDHLKQHRESTGATNREAAKS
jgi:hypothetical protein